MTAKILTLRRLYLYIFLAMVMILTGIVLIDNGDTNNRIIPDSLGNIDISNQSIAPLYQEPTINSVLVNKAVILANNHLFDLPSWLLFKPITLVSYDIILLFTVKSPQEHIVKKGETLDKILRNYGLDAETAQSFITEIKKYFRPTDLHIGQKLSLILEPFYNKEKISYRLQSLFIPMKSLETVIVWRDNQEQLFSEKLTRPSYELEYHFKGQINGSIAETAQNNKIPYPIVDQLIRAFSHEVDFQRDIYPNATFEIIYTLHIDADNRLIKPGTMSYANLEIVPDNKNLEIFAYIKDSEMTFFHRDGTSARRFLLKTPLDGGRISSGYGMRYHPVLGYSRMHKGIDFAAPTGTVIYAAGNGTITVMEYRKGYGNLIRIQHNNQYTTAYAHLNTFAKNLKTGQSVKQGQIIGYVGKTGLATGPHLHFEVIKDGQQINPTQLKFGTQEKLSNDALKKFLKRVEAIDQKRSQQPRLPSSIVETNKVKADD